jgi:nucleoside-diphosphate kinase
MIERTLTIFKPDALRKRVQGHMLQHLLDDGFEVRAMRMLQLTKSQAEGFYEVHKERSFFGELVAFMTSGPVVVVCLERDDAVSRLRTVMGPTDSTKAPADTVRGRFGTDIQCNAIHGSDSPENAQREIAYFFPGLDLLASGTPAAETARPGDVAWSGPSTQRPPRIKER